MPARNGSHHSSNNGGGDGLTGAFTQDVQARLFLFVACLWPLWVLALFGASSAGNNEVVVSPDSVVASSSHQNRLNLRNVLDRVDIMGYGPTHPRIAFVVVGEESEATKETVVSIFRNTDLNRIFLITTILDGLEEDSRLVDALHQMDQGNVPHWHGLRPDLHLDHKKEHTEKEHGRKIQTFFHPDRIGVTAARLEGVEFIQLLEEKHLQAGLKSPEEDLILVLLQAGLTLKDQNWLSAVTNALIVPPPILRIEEEEGALKLANAVSLRLEDPGKVTSFDEKFVPVLQADAKAADINSSSGQSYGTPALNGGGIAMRLETFVHLPAQDESLMDPWPANLDLALNLWLCADGIDILEDAQITTSSSNNPWMESLPIVPLDARMAARFAAVWMDETMQRKFFQSYSSSITMLDWETKIQDAKQSPTFPNGNLAKRCRSFEWYAKEINADLAKILEQSGFAKSAATKSGGTAGGGGIVKKAEMAGVAAEIEIHEGRKTVEEPAKAVVVEDASQHEDHHEPPPIPEVIDPVVVYQRPKPKIPLRPTNLEIVQKATPIDISYVPVHGGHKEHPHMGAKDEDGNWGYVHDEKALRLNPPPLTWPNGYEEQACSMRDNNYRMLTERVVIDREYDLKMNDLGGKRDKIFCLVYTIESGHPRIPNIRETWGPKCDGFMVGSTKTDKSLGTVEIPHEGPEEYNNIWQKVRSMWSYIYDNYYEEYDWFHIGGDDLFLLVENMRLYLESDEIKTAANGGIYLPFGNETMQTPLLLGRRFKYQGHTDEIFDSGGSGYTMNKAAFKLLVTEGFPNYFPHAHTFSEDTMVAKLFRKMGVLAYDTKDDEGGERYMPFMPGHHWSYHLPKDPTKDWYAMYSIDIKEGPEHCSPKSLAFHYVKDQVMKRLFALAYGLCPDKYMKR